MSFLRSSPGGIVRPMVSRTGGGLLRAGPNIAAPPLVVAPSAYNFELNQPGTRTRGWWGTNDQFENFFGQRDWQYNFADAQYSFGSLRNQFTFSEILEFQGRWQPAGGDVNRIYRKGSSGQDAHTLVLECGANPAPVPVGDKLVLWISDGPGDYQGGTLSLSGYNLPLRRKMTVTASEGSGWGDPDGTRIIEIDAEQSLPAIDFYPARYDGGWFTRSKVQHRHWSFYANAATKECRFPLAQFADLAINQVLANGGSFLSGGQQFFPTWNDYSREWNMLGASLIEEYWAMECAGLADLFGNCDPRYMAVELENEPTREWRDIGDGPGYGDLLPDVWYGTARRIWGPERTLIVKSTDFGGLNSLIDTFDWRPPTGDNVHLVHHSYDLQVRGPGGLYGFTDIGQTDWMAQQVRAKVNALGFKGGGTTELGVDLGRSDGNADRGQRLGRVITSYTNQNLYAFVWGMVGDAVRCSDIYNIGGHDIETFWPEVRPYARRANIMTT